MNSTCMVAISRIRGTDFSVISKTVKLFFCKKKPYRVIALGQVVVLLRIDTHFADIHGFMNVALVGAIP